MGINTELPSTPPPPSPPYSPNPPPTFGMSIYDHGIYNVTPGPAHQPPSPSPSLPLHPSPSVRWRAPHPVWGVGGEADSEDVRHEGEPRPRLLLPLGLREKTVEVGRLHIHVFVCVFMLVSVRVLTRATVWSCISQKHKPYWFLKPIKR